MHKKLWFQESRGGLSKTHQATVSSSRSIPTCSRKSPHEWKRNGGNLGYPLIGGELRQESLELVKWRLVGGIPTPLKNDGVRQWEEWQPIYEMENKKMLETTVPRRFFDVQIWGIPKSAAFNMSWHPLDFGGLTRMSWVLFEAPFWCLQSHHRNRLSSWHSTTTKGTTPCQTPREIVTPC